MVEWVLRCLSSSLSPFSFHSFLGSLLLKSPNVLASTSRSQIQIPSTIPSWPCQQTPFVFIPILQLHVNYQCCRIRTYLRPALIRTLLWPFELPTKSVNATNSPETEADLFVDFYLAVILLPSWIHKSVYFNYSGDYVYYIHCDWMEAAGMSGIKWYVDTLNMACGNDANRV